LAAASERSSDNAKAIGLSLQRTSRILNSALFQSELARLRASTESAVRLPLYGETLAAIDTLARLRETAADEQVQLAAAKALLERTPKVSFDGGPVE